MAKKTTKKERVQNNELEEYLKDAAEWRFNTLTGAMEFRNEDTAYRWRTVEEYELNTFSRRIFLERYLPVSAQGIQKVIKSEFSPKVDPILHYFQELTPWTDSEPDYIQQVADCIRSNHREKDKFWKKWIVGVVANVINQDKCDNQVCLCLRGKQGIRKSSFFAAICPPGLTDYFHIGHVDTSMKNKDLNGMLVCNVLVVFDDCLAENLQYRPNETKGIITLPHVRYRMAYAKSPSTWPHNASFGATLNDEEFLSDTENRRWLVFDTQWIDHTTLKEINMEGLYRQAKTIYESGKFQHWFDNEEQSIIELENDRFKKLSEEEMMIEKYFDLPGGADHKEKATHHLPAGEILSRIRRKEKSFHPSVEKLGRALVALGGQKWQKREGDKKPWVYSVIEKSDSEIEQQYDANTEASKRLKKEETQKMSEREIQEARARKILAEIDQTHNEFV